MKRSDKFELFFIIIIMLITLFMCTQKPLSAQSNCIPREITITIGDNSPGNPQITLNSELGCVYNVFTDMDGYLPINTSVNFTNARYFPINGEITTVSGNGVIVGYQLTRLINTQGLLYIIRFDGNKEMRLHPFEFEVQ